MAVVNSSPHLPMYGTKSRSSLPLNSVYEQASDLTKMVEHTHRQLGEAERLLERGLTTLCVEERSWVENTIVDTQDAARAITVLVEPVRVDLITRNGNISFITRLLWKIRGSRKVEAKRAQLLLCHNSLIPVIDLLRRHTASIPIEIGDGRREDLRDEGSVISSTLLPPLSPALRPSSLSSSSKNEVGELLAWKRMKRSGRPSSHRSQSVAELAVQNNNT
ncbi:hypothetical protein FQN57_003809 [Myotisia sp. PD_48]|nr:hypothetical protein FQN57_003809 [Myotisia sp. PD_48]